MTIHEEDNSSEGKGVNRTLSSAQTFFMKLIFPLFWIAGFGFMALSPFLGRFRDNSDFDGMKWFFLSVWLLGTVFVYWACVRLKRVRIDNEALYISNYIKEIRV